MTHGILLIESIKSNNSLLSKLGTIRRVSLFFISLSLSSNGVFSYETT